MAGTITLNTRIQSKYDTYTNWSTNNPTLLQGEIAVVTVDAVQGDVSQVPAVLIKVGDGVTAFNDLPWGSALAADVYPWAKAATKPTYQASEISGLDEYISGKIEDTNTKYQLVSVNDTTFKLQSQDVNQPDWTDVTTITITYTLTTGETDGTVKFNGVEVPVAGLGSAAYTESNAYDPAGSAAGVQSALLGASSDPSTSMTLYGVKAYAGEQASAAQTAAQGYADTQISAAKTELIGTGAGVTATTIKGAVTEANTYTDEQITAKISGVYKPVGSVTFSQLPAQVTAEMLGNVYNVTDAFTADDRFVTGEQSQQYPAGTNVAVVEVSDAYYFDALAGIVDLSAYATQVWVNEQISAESENLIGNESGVTANTIQGAVVEAKGYADTLNTAMNTRVETLETNVGGTPVATQIQTAIQALDNSDQAVANQFVTQVVQTDGVVAVTRAQPQIADVANLQTTLDAKVDASSLADIATTGNVNDLIQTSGDWIVFNCGSSTVNI